MLADLLERRRTRRLHEACGASTFSLNDTRQGLMAFLRDFLEEPVTLEGFERLSAGGSNATYKFTFLRDAGASTLVMKVKQPGTIETSVSREHQLTASLVGRYPVPRPFAAVEDERYFGSPAILFSHASGIQAPVSDRPKATGMGTRFDDQVRETLAPQFVRYEARLHALPWSPSDLTLFDAPRPGTTDAIDWRLAFWNTVWDEDKFEDHPALTLAAEWLQDNRPVADSISMLHGDYRNGNFLYDPVTAQITRIIDWELCGLGDRHCDLGYTMLKAWGYYDGTGTFLNSALVSLDDFVKIYEDEAGLTIDPKRLHYYIVYNVWWSAIALLGSGLRNAHLRETNLDVMYNLIAGKGVFDVRELNRLVLGV